MFARQEDKRVSSCICRAESPMGWVLPVCVCVDRDERTKGQQAHVAPQNAVMPQQQSEQLSFHNPGKCKVCKVIVNFPSYIFTVKQTKKKDLIIKTHQEAIIRLFKSVQIEPANIRFGVCPLLKWAGLFLRVCRLGLKVKVIHISHMWGLPVS